MSTKTNRHVVSMAGKTGIGTNIQSPFIVVYERGVCQCFAELEAQARELAAPIFALGHRGRCPR